MPAVVAPIVAAAGAVKGAVAAAGIMKSMAVAGTALSAVGAVTKNKKLVKIGAVIGTVGTLGSVGAFGQAAKTWGMSAPAQTAKSFAAQNIRPGLQRQPMASGEGLLAKGKSWGPGSALKGTLNQPSPTFGQQVGSALKTGVEAINKNPGLATIAASAGSEIANYLSGRTDAELRDLESQIDLRDANAQQTIEAIENEKRRRQNLNMGYLQVNPVIPVANPQQQQPGLLAQAIPGGRT
jgi:hypothetical protein